MKSRGRWGAVAGAGLGLVLATAGLAALAVCASRSGTAPAVVGCVVFGAALVLCYGASTLYHAVERPRAKRVLRALDHSAIFLLIAGTYTPTLVSLRGPWGWSLFGSCGGSPRPGSRCASPCHDGRPRCSWGYSAALMSALRQ